MCVCKCSILMESVEAQERGKAICMARETSAPHEEIPGRAISSSRRAAGAAVAEVARLTRSEGERERQRRSEGERETEVKRVHSHECTSSCLHQFAHAPSALPLSRALSRSLALSRSRQLLLLARLDLGAAARRSIYSSSSLRDSISERSVIRVARESHARLQPRHDHLDHRLDLCLLHFLGLGAGERVRGRGQGEGAAAREVDGVDGDDGGEATVLLVSEMPPRPRARETVADDSVRTNISTTASTSAFSTSSALARVSECAVEVKEKARRREK